MSRYIAAHQREQKIGPDGQKLCIWCGKPVAKGRRRYCDDPQCPEEVYIRARPDHARLRVWQRDHGVCALCGVDTRGAYEVDHIIPVVEGGGACGLENLRTLCVPCHRAETAALARRRAKKPGRVRQPTTALQTELAL